MTVIGARPQFIKAAVLSRAIKARNKEFAEILVHTGQHYDSNMSDLFFKEMDIPAPDHRLSINQKSHGEMTGEMLIALDKLTDQCRPDIVLVYGDTNTTLAGALVAAKKHLPVAHIEAGLRSYNRHMPEEINRILTDAVADWLFCPTTSAEKNLLKENVPGKIHVVGDIMYDALKYYSRMNRASEAVKKIIDGTGGIFSLCTLHRQENTDNQAVLSELIEAIRTISTTRNPVILPLHPRTAKYVKNYGLSLDGIHCIEPVGYFDMLYLLKHAQNIITDSGGLQKEAYFCKKPALVLRKETEWVELLENKVAVLAHGRVGSIIDGFDHLKTIYHFPDNLYGNGRTAEAVLDCLTAA